MLLKGVQSTGSAYGRRAQENNTLTCPGPGGLTLEICCLLSCGVKIGCLLQLLLPIGRAAGQEDVGRH